MVLSSPASRPVLLSCTRRQHRLPLSNPQGRRHRTQCDATNAVCRRGRGLPGKNCRGRRRSARGPARHQAFSEVLPGTRLACPGRMAMGEGMSVHSTLPGSVDPAGLPPLLASGRPGGQDRAQLADWALAALADAEARMANLQARIAYLEGLSVTDELTGLFNRRGFANELSRALASARRGGPHGALLICDLDGFKGVNDRYGHAAGDDVLRQVALLLVGASKRGAAEKAMTFRRLIGDTRFTHEGGEMSVAVSIGCAYYTGEEETEDDLFRRADAAMYADKRLARRGRPRLAVA